MRKSGIAVMIVGLAASLALAGCSSSDEPTGSGSSDAGEEPKGPLDKYMSAMWQAPSEEQQAQQTARVNELVTKCMVDQGFEYKGDSSGGMVVSTDDLGLDWESREFAEQYGYGLSTNPFGNPDEDGDGDQWSDPNQAYTDGLSATAKESYYAALYGETPSTEDVDPEDPGSYDWKTAGCMGQANHEVYDAANPYEDPKYQQLMEDMSELYTQASNDPRYTDINAQWATCMVKQGVTEFDSPDEARQSISARTNEVWGLETNEGGTGGAVTVMGSGSGGEDQAKIDAELAKIRPDELKLALTDWDCKDSTGYAKAAQEIQFQLEQDFVDQHKAELDEMLAQYGTK